MYYIHIYINVSFQNLEPMGLATMLRNVCTVMLSVYLTSVHVLQIDLSTLILSHVT